VPTPQPPDLDLTEISANRYISLDIIGAGSIGVVYRVQDRGLNNEPVALKLMNSAFLNDPVYVSRFRREVAVARKLSHPHIVKIFDFGQLQSGGYFFTMELVEGEDLRKLITRHKAALPIEDALNFFFQIVVALDYAHGAGIIHRDIKPENILVSRDSRDIKLTDFSSAREIVLDQGLTPEGGVIGTPHYLAPELLKSKSVSPLIDIYSVGILLFELLTGAPPFTADAVAAVFAQHLTKPIPKIKNARSDAPDWCQELAEICTEKDPSNRFSSMSELLGELFRQATKSGYSLASSAIPYSILQLSKSSLRRRSLLSWASGLTR
jgi:serine/threonine protein kinase